MDVLLGIGRVPHGVEGSPYGAQEGVTQRKHSCREKGAQKDGTPAAATQEAKGRRQGIAMAPDKPREGRNGNAVESERSKAQHKCLRRLDAIPAIDQVNRLEQQPSRTEAEEDAEEEPKDSVWLPVFWRQHADEATFSCQGTPAEPGFGPDCGSEPLSVPQWPGLAGHQHPRIRVRDHYQPRYQGRRRALP